MEFKIIFKRKLPINHTGFKHIVDLPKVNFGQEGIDYIESQLDVKIKKLKEINNIIKPIKLTELIYYPTWATARFLSKRNNKRLYETNTVEVIVENDNLNFYYIWKAVNDNNNENVPYSIKWELDTSILFIDWYMASQTLNWNLKPLS